MVNASALTMESVTNENRTVIDSVTLYKRHS